MSFLAGMPNCLQGCASSSLGHNERLLHLSVVAEILVEGTTSLLVTLDGSIRASKIAGLFIAEFTQHDLEYILFSVDSCCLSPSFIEDVSKWRFFIPLPG